MKRTASELQLMEDEVMADYRDFCMYIRILNGMNARRSWTELPCDNCEMQNIIRTRHRPVEEGPSSYMREGLERHSINSPLVPQKVILKNTISMVPAPSLAINTDTYNHSRKTTRFPTPVIQEPADSTDELNQTLGTMNPISLPVVFNQNLDPLHLQNEDLEGVFMMDDDL